MFMRIVWGKLQTGAWERFEETYRKVLQPGSGGIEGLRGRWLVRDISDPDAGYSVSLWETREAMARYETTPFFRETVLPALQPFFLGDFMTRHCVVKVMEEFPAGR
jgi:heme-degrading monooxygenase HmoA